MSTYMYHQRPGNILHRIEQSDVVSSEREQMTTVNFLNIRTPRKFVVITLKFWTMLLYLRVTCPNDAYGMANSVDLDQTASLGAVWSGSALFAQAYLSENLGSLWYEAKRVCEAESEAQRAQSQSQAFIIRVVILGIDLLYLQQTV